jgi:hypothetical protein
LLTAAAFLSTGLIGFPLFSGFSVFSDLDPISVV